MAQKQRILAAGDFHGSSIIATRLAEKAERENVDLVIICGDVCNFGQECQNVIKPFVQRKQKLLFIPGNHDPEHLTHFLTEFYGIKNLHGYSIEHHNIGIFGCGAGENLGPAQSLTEEEMTKKLRKAHQGIEGLDKKIMVTHMHPAKSEVEQLCGFEGSNAVRKAITEHKPDILVCCHIHELEGYEETIENTRVINVGRRGKIIEI